MEHFEILSWPTEHVRALTGFEKFLRGVPIVRQLTGLNTWQARRRAVANRIENQLLARSMITPDAWANNAQTIEFARFLAAAISEEMGWPSVAFLPDDPMEILCWPHRDGLDDVELRLRIQENVGRILSEEQVIAISKMTFRQATEFLVSMR